MAAIITKITAQKRNKSRYNLYLDRGSGEEYACSVDEDVLIKYHLRKGLKLQDEELSRLLEEDEMKKAYHLALHYLSYRMRSIDEVRSYLQKKEKKPSDIEAVIAKLLEQRLLNDGEFARAYIRSKKNSLLRGPFKLKQELLQKGVKADVVDQALMEFPAGEQEERIAAWLQKQQSRSPKLSEQAWRTKLANQLMSKGFTREVITAALQQVELTNSADEEWEAVVHQGEKLFRKYTKYEGWERQQRIKQALYRKGFSLEIIERFLTEHELK
ncbi:recombination regulator RecX [Alkalihalobacillus oceani]|uniref:recombination regulator RecX n=1 Tax=Halalkalibacter oceani TaxID=1653776 RepID=UPI00203CA90F|nr:recombination regulator RecX [Halalkalibacter oceani]MCM3762229.1 recombination regulator RecX [Halalkalibacter oceani]